MCTHLGGWMTWHKPRAEWRLHSRMGLNWHTVSVQEEWGRCGSDDKSVVTEFLYIYIYIHTHTRIYILTGKFWDDWSFQQRFWFLFFFFLFQITLCCAFYSEKTCLYFWLVFGKHLILSREGEEVVISGRRAEWIWRFLYWLQCSPSFLPPSLATLTLM